MCLLAGHSRQHAMPNARGGMQHRNVFACHQLVNLNQWIYDYGSITIRCPHSNNRKPHVDDFRRIGRRTQILMWPACNIMCFICFNTRIIDCVSYATTCFEHTPRIFVIIANE